MPPSDAGCAKPAPCSSVEPPPRVRVERRHRLDSPRRTGNPWGAGPHLRVALAGGSQLAVGLGHGHWSVGTDGGGSVRIPASSTGTVASSPRMAWCRCIPPVPRHPRARWTDDPHCRRRRDDARCPCRIRRARLVGPTDPTMSLVSSVCRTASKVCELRSRPILDGSNEQVDAAVRAERSGVRRGRRQGRRGRPAAPTPSTRSTCSGSPATQVLQPFGEDALDQVDPGWSR